MSKNTGIPFEEIVFEIIENQVKSNEFLLSNPNVKVHRKAKYYSRDRESQIECEISVEKYLGDSDKGGKPSIIVVIECKDYAQSIPVDDVEEFHAKLQQIGADNTKGIMVTRNGYFQKSALSYANAKGIALARILPDDQVDYFMYKMIGNDFSNQFSSVNNARAILKALTEKNYHSEHCEDFFSLTGEHSLENLVCRFL